MSCDHRNQLHEPALLPDGTMGLRCLRCGAERDVEPAHSANIQRAIEIVRKLSASDV